MFNIFLGCSVEARKYGEIIKEIIEENPFLKVIPWWANDLFRQGTYVIPQLLNSIQNIDYAILIGTPDDVIKKRRYKSSVFRDNVILEYGLFAGLIGIKNVALMQIGEVNIPTDLNGMNLTRVPEINYWKWRTLSIAKTKNILRSSIRSCIDDLLQTNIDSSTISIAELRYLRSPTEYKDLLPIICNSVERRLETVMFGRVPIEDIQDILKRHQVHHRRHVGSEGHITEISNFIDFSLMENSDLDLLASAFSQFAAAELRKSCHNNHCSTRIILEKKSDLKDQRFLSQTVRKLGIKPAIVDPDNGQMGKNVIGRFIQGESAVFLHDFTGSGYRPKKCIAHIREYGVHSNAIVTFLIRRSHYDSLLRACEDEGVALHTFGIQNHDGSLELTVN